MGEGVTGDSPQGLLPDLLTLALRGETGVRAGNPNCKEMNERPGGFQKRRQGERRDSVRPATGPMEQSEAI